MVSLRAHLQMLESIPQVSTIIMKGFLAFLLASFLPRLSGIDLSSSCVVAAVQTGDQAVCASLEDLQAVQAGDKEVQDVTFDVEVCDRG